MGEEFIGDEMIEEDWDYEEAMGEWLDPDTFDPDIFFIQKLYGSAGTFNMLAILNKESGKKCVFPLEVRDFGVPCLN